MRSSILRSGKTLTGAAMLIGLLACSSFGQETPQRSEPALTPCDGKIVHSLPGTGAGQTGSQRGSVQAAVVSDALPPVKPKCDSASLGVAGQKPLNWQTTDGAPNGEQVSFDWRASRPDAPFAARTRRTLAQTQDAQSPPPQASATEAQELAKKLSNPVASLISLPLQSNFDFGMGTGSGWRYTLNIQPVIPVSLSPKWNLISRTIIPVIHQAGVTGPNSSQSGLGDTVQSLFFSPNKTEPFIWAVGPVFLLPTATDAALGAQKWGVGPTALVLKQTGGWTYGVLANHIWSVAGKSNRGDVNATFVQPFLAYTTKQAWTYNLNTESTFDWVSNSWSIPIIPSISKLVRFGKQPISFRRRS